MTDEQFPDKGLENSPLDLVVCQVRHERRALATDSGRALLIYEALGGRNGPYPNLEQITGVEANVNLGPQGGVLHETKSDGWRFSSQDGSWSVTILPDHFALETNRYKTWADDFSPRFSNLAVAIREHIDPTFEQRIGLRYINTIKGLPVVTLSDWIEYLKPELVGLPLHPVLGKDVIEYQAQTMVKLNDEASAVFRYGNVKNPQGGNEFLLDIDVFRQGGRAYLPREAVSAADNFNRYALHVFHSSIKQKLYGILE